MIIHSYMCVYIYSGPVPAHKRHGIGLGLLGVHVNSLFVYIYAGAYAPPPRPTGGRALRGGDPVLTPRSRQVDYAYMFIHVYMCVCIYCARAPQQRRRTTDR